METSKLRMEKSLQILFRVLQMTRDPSQKHKPELFSLRALLNIHRKCHPYFEDAQVFGEHSVLPVGGDARNKAASPLVRHHEIGGKISRIKTSSHMLLFTIGIQHNISPTATQTEKEREM
ncbi:hypothetical protein F2P79_005872 [Pimephales promelas]|nr:hypothetical protein F2P79_005872 [Pimephales promelas]